MNTLTVILIVGPSLVIYFALRLTYVLARRIETKTRL